MRIDPTPIRVLADQAFSRAVGAPLIEGNHVDLLRDAKENYTGRRRYATAAAEAIANRLALETLELTTVP